MTRVEDETLFHPSVLKQPEHRPVFELDRETEAERRHDECCTRATQMSHSCVKFRHVLMSSGWSLKVFNLLLSPVPRLSTYEPAVSGSRFMERSSGTLIFSFVTVFYRKTTFLFKVLKVNVTKQCKNHASGWWQHRQHSLNNTCIFYYYWYFYTDDAKIYCRVNVADRRLGLSTTLWLKLNKYSLFHRKLSELTGRTQMYLRRLQWADFTQPKWFSTVLLNLTISWWSSD